MDKFGRAVKFEVHQDAVMTEGNETAQPIPQWKLFIFGHKPNRTLMRLVVLTIMTLVLFKCLLVPIKVVGISMVPTYDDGAVNFVNKWSYVRTSPKRGDVVAVRGETGEARRMMPSGASRNGPGEVLYLKRIVGLPGETVALVDGRIQINGRPLHEPYARSLVPFERVITLKPDQYFVIGDNRQVTILGTISGEDILGKVVF
jgi:signal peptidase I